MKKSKVDYQRIFMDILNRKFPHKIEECSRLLNKKSLSVLEVIELNKKIFGLEDEATEAFNQSHRSYSRSSILQILDFQKKNKLNNSQTAIHFRTSRHTIAKWKKRYLS
ncbi:helix-turn-helix domain-containing protein [Chryseobacterium nematophagum]|uniref:Helix-turn-helix domain-containing protein n=1 Tax=Chryseobacterium nematophagum TaxID=2305228 RepID=A0A3M7TFT0_9FLAO|nr:helix-turn-helix domain-containing protein [Chryseobacterium nematophagum]RNA61070.1 helix-turn-helix domain-containing protein [Chryseobacterium nematophagum]